LSINLKSFKNLRNLGLTSNQAKIYLSLIESGGLTAKQISLLSNVPESKVYDLLHQLEDTKWIEIESGRPNIFKPKSPSEVIKNVKLRKISELENLEKEIIEELEPLYLRNSEAEKPDIWILRGQERLLIKLREMIEKANSKILIALPYITPEIMDIMFPILQSVKMRGVKIVSVLPRTESSEIVEKIKLVSEPIYVNQLFGGGIIVDEREVLIVLIDPLLGIWSDHIGLAQVATGYFNYSWGEQKRL
jgi:sugar-specific transcriptional regulator TrmB